MHYDPWDDLARRPDIVCRACRLPENVEGMWFPDIPGIALDERLDRVGRRSALAHELVHVDHGDTQVAHLGPDGPRLARRQEIRADREAARRLIPLERLGAVMACHRHDLAAVAAELDVTAPLLVDRIENLRPAEQKQLRALLDRNDHAA